MSSNYFTETYLWSALPLILAFVILLYFAARAACLFVGSNSIDRSRHQSQLYGSCATYLLLMTYLVLPPVSLKQFQSLNCQSIRGESFLRIDSSINCNSEAYFNFQQMIGFCVALQMTIPPFWLYLLWKQRRRLNPPTNDLRLAYHMRDSDEQLAPLSFLFAPYQPSFYYFESLEM